MFLHVFPCPSNPIQIIGMSATLPNLDLLARWLDADLYRTDYRPVALSEHVEIGKTVFDPSIQGSWIHHCYVFTSVFIPQ